jgi:hypothetical protein
MSIKLSTVADLLGTITPMLGFVPTDSIVVYLLRTRDTETVIVSIARIDADSPIDTTAATIRDLNLPAMGVNAVMIAAICEHNDPHAWDLISSLNEAITHAGATVLRRLHTAQVEHPGQWTDIDTGATGATYGYRDSITAASYVRQGRVITGRREHIEHEFEPADPAPPVEVGDHAQLVTNTFTHIAQALAGLRRITPTLAAHTGIVLTESKHLRDQLLILGSEEPHLGAELWTTIARHLRGPARIEALTLAAITHYAASDAVRAGIALDAARDTATESHSPLGELSQLVHGAIRSGISPQQMRDLLANITAPPPPAD